MAGEQGLYILLNKSSDFISGICLGTEYSPEEGSVRLRKGLRNGSFITKLYDTGAEGMTWHRLVLDTRAQNNSSLGVTLYTCDREADAEQIRKSLAKTRELADHLTFHEDREKQKKTISKIDTQLKKLETAWEPYRMEEFSGADDVLLNKVRGRYLWLVFDFQRNFQRTPQLHEVRVEFPKRSYLDYLPELYRQEENGAEFLHRFLSVFRKMDEELENSIEQFPAMMEAAVTEREYLEWLAELLGMEESGLWNDSQLRYLLKNCARLYQIRGTKEYLAELTELYSERKPVIIQYHDPVQQKETYCSHPFEFAMLLPEPAKMNTDIYQNLLRVIELSKPAWMECRLIILRPYCFMDQYSYTGINTVLGQYRPAILNDEIMIPYAACEGTGEESEEDTK